jgi:hypothetical protein
MRSNSKFPGFECSPTTAETGEDIPIIYIDGRHHRFGVDVKLFFFMAAAFKVPFAQLLARR